MDEKRRIRVTKEGLEKYQKEYNTLTTDRRAEIAAMIAEARSYGDLSENAEYSAAKDEEAKLNGRIAELEAILNPDNHVVVGLAELDNGIVQFGTRVTVKERISHIVKNEQQEVTDIWYSYGEEETYEITLPRDCDPFQGKVSDESPFGKAALGKTVGERFQVVAPAGAFEYEILDVTLAQQ